MVRRAGKPKACAQRLASGRRCGGFAVHDADGAPSRFCFQHNPTLADARAAGRARGGFRLAQKLKGQPWLDGLDLKTRGGVQEAIERLARRVLANEMQPARANTVLRSLESLRDALPPAPTVRVLPGVCETCACAACARGREALGGTGSRDLTERELELAQKIADEHGVPRDEIVARVVEGTWRKERQAASDAEVQRLSDELEQSRARVADLEAQQAAGEADEGQGEGDAAPPANVRTLREQHEPDERTALPRGGLAAVRAAEAGTKGNHWRQVSP